MTVTKAQIEKAIALSRAFNDALPAPPVGPVSTSALLNMPDNMECLPEFQALKAFLHALSDAELRELQAIMFIGRGDYRPKDFARALKETQWDSNREREVDYVMEKVCAADYFADGFEKLNRARMI